MMLASRILYEDNHLILVNKIPGEIVQGDKTGDEPLSETVKKYIKEKYNKPGNVFHGVVHRLDRPVSGIVIFAKTGKALARLNEMLQKREIRKVYWAVVASSQFAVRSSQSSKHEITGNWELGTGNSIHLVHYLKRNEEKNRSFVYDAPGPGRVKAELIYRIAGISNRYQLFEVELLTGRHHQIRAQLAAIGFPIRGDLKYGYPRSNPDGSISLHAHEVEFVHPVKGETVRIICPPLSEKIWAVFNKK